MNEPEIQRARRVSIELKYAIITILVMILFIALHIADAFSGVNNTVKSGVDWLAGLGSIGVFFLALVANASIIIQIPYTLPLLSAALGGASFAGMMLLGVASGLGAGIGALAGYKVADALVGRSPTPPDGRVFRWMARNVDRRPRLTTFVIFGIAASPLPDTTVVMPLALVRYGMRRAALPLFLGKFVHNVLLALLFYGFASWSAEHVSEQASTDLALAVAVVFMLLVLYSAEKARAGAAGRRSSPETGGELAEPPA
ncbi:MAG: hypothetical protein WD271_03660 [Acidimicrobiia bacterium]